MKDGRGDSFVLFIFKVCGAYRLKKCAVMSVIRLKKCIECWFIRWKKCNFVVGK